MELAKTCIDVGLFTAQLEPMRKFWGERIGLKFEEMLPVGGGVRQFRYYLRGSVLKINHSREPLPERAPSGYRRIIVADSRRRDVMRLEDPDGNEVQLVPEGHNGVTRIEIELEVTNVAEFAAFYVQTLGATRLGPSRYKLGDTIIGLTASSRARRTGGASASPIESMAGRGYRYLTVQVRDCDAEHRRLIAVGAREGAPPRTLGNVARICFIRDPDGNWIEISQRASLTGALPP